MYFHGFISLGLLQASFSPFLTLILLIPLFFLFWKKSWTIKVQKLNHPLLSSVLFVLLYTTQSFSQQLSLLNYEDGVVDPTSIIPMIDGGTEGFKGNARVILPGMTSCIDCTLDLFPPQVKSCWCALCKTLRRKTDVNVCTCWKKRLLISDFGFVQESNQHCVWTRFIREAEYLRYKESNTPNLR